MPPEKKNAPSGPIRVMLVDDHTLMRSGIRALMEAIPNVTVVGEAADGYAMLELITEARPDIILADISMPGMNGLEAMRRALRQDPTLSIVVLSMHQSEEFVVQALRAGASGFIVKDAATQELELAISAVANGHYYLSPTISHYLILDLLKGDGNLRSPLELLSNRQREVLQLVAEGHSTSDIARRLKISVKTVESHRASLMERLSINDVQGLVRFAMANGLISESS